MFLFDGCFVYSVLVFDFFILRRVESYVMFVRVSNTYKSRITVSKVAFNKKNTLSASNLHLTFGKKLVEFYLWSTALCGTEIWTLGKVDQKHPDSFEMWYWRMIEISWTYRVKIEEVSQRVKEERNVLHSVKKEGRLTGLVTSGVGTAL